MKIAKYSYPELPLLKIDYLGTGKIPVRGEVKEFRLFTVRHNPHVGIEIDGEMYIIPVISIAEDVVRAIEGELEPIPLDEISMPDSQEEQNE